MYRAYLIALVMLLVAFAMGGAAAQSAAEQPTGITVSGTASVTAQPDIAVVTLGVVTEDKDSAKAAQANARTTNTVIDAILKTGVAKRDVQTVQYTISPIIDYNRKPPVTTGYRVTNSVRVKVRDLVKVGSVIDAGTGAGANDVSGPNFSVEDDTPYRQQALAEAAKNAEVKAEVIAKALGVKVGSAVSATESQVRVFPMAKTLGGAQFEASQTQIMTGELQISADVTVRFAIL